MRAFPALAIVFFLMGSCVGLDVFGGSSVDGSEGDIVIISSNPSPISVDLSSSISRYRDITKYRDPSQYSSPPIEPKPKPEPNPPTPANNDTSSENVQEMSETFGLTVTSNVKGTGGHTRWISIGDISDLKAKDTSSAKNGSLDLVNVLILSNIITDRNATAGIITSRSLSFIGNSYREMEDYSNGEGYVKERIEAGAIRKNTTYYASFNNLTSDPEEIPDDKWKLYQRRSTYTLDTRFTGSLGFDAHIPGRNTSDISEFYAGRMAIKNTLTSLENSSFKSYEEGHLPCCETSPDIGSGT